MVSEIDFSQSFYSQIFIKRQMKIHAWKRNELEAENLEEKPNFSLLYKPIKLIMVFNTSDKRFLSKWNRYHNQFFFYISLTRKNFLLLPEVDLTFFGFYRNLFCYLRQNSKFDFLFFFQKNILFRSLVARKKSEKVFRFLLLF